MVTPPLLSPDAQIASTLAALAYVRHPEKPVQHLADPVLPMAGEAPLVWGPGEHGSNRMYVVGGMRGGGRRPPYVVAIRGTIGSIEGIFEDVEIDLVTLPWSGPHHASGRINKGIADAVEHLRAMRSGSKPQCLLQFLCDTEVDASNAVLSMPGTSTFSFGSWRHPIPSNQL